MGFETFLDRSQLWISIVAFIVFSLGSGVIAGYLAGRLDEFGRYAMSLTVMGLSMFFLLLLTYTVYLKAFARMPVAWTGPLLWSLYPAMIPAVLLGWYVAQQRNAASKG